MGRFIYPWAASEQFELNHLGIKVLGSGSHSSQVAVGKGICPASHTDADQTITSAQVKDEIRGLVGDFVFDRLCFACELRDGGASMGVGFFRITQM